MSRAVTVLALLWMLGVNVAWALLAQGGLVLAGGARPSVGEHPEQRSPAPQTTPAIDRRIPPSRVELRYKPTGLFKEGDELMEIESVDPEGPFKDRYKVRDHVPLQELQTAQEELAH